MVIRLPEDVPELNILWPKDARIDFLWLQIYGYMGWPHNDAERSAQCARFFAAWLAAFETEVLEGDRMAPHRQYLRQMFNGLGGFKALLSAPGNSPFPLEEVATVGHILTTVRSIEVHHPELRGGSVKKAIFLIDEFISTVNPQVKQNQKYIREAWAKFKDVAHLAAAFVLTTHNMREDIGDDLEEFGVFLAIAKDFEMFGVSFYPHAQKRPLLDPSRIWSVPNYPWLPKIPCAPRLHKDNLPTLKRYHVDTM